MQIRDLEEKYQELESQLQGVRQQLLQQGTEINALKTENQGLRQSQLINTAVSIVSCPVCFESRVDHHMVVFFCGHILCDECRRTIDQSRNNRCCPKCRRSETNAYIELFL